MRNLGIAANALRLVSVPEPDSDRRAESAAAEMLTMLLLDAAAADRWLSRPEADVGEARSAIARIAGHARRLMHDLDRTTPPQGPCSRGALSAARLSQA